MCHVGFQLGRHTSAPGMHGAGVLNDAFASIGPELAQKYFNDMLRKLDEC